MYRAQTKNNKKTKQWPHPLLPKIALKIAITITVKIIKYTQTSLQLFIILIKTKKLAYIRAITST